MFNRKLLPALGLALVVLAVSLPAAAQGTKLTVGLPGVPPVFSTVIQYVAQEQGLFKKYGLDVTLRNFDSGAAAARAVQSGDIDASFSPTPVIVNMISNAGVNIVALYGMENTDWLIASTDPAFKACADVKGQGVGVDSINGARSVALREMIAPCGLKSSDVQEVALSANVGAAMVAGQLKLGVLHIDDVPVIEEQTKKKLTFVSVMKDVNPLNHYLALVALRDKVAANRDAYVRLVAAHIEATRFMIDPKNLDRVAQIAAPTGRSPAIARAAMVEYVKMEYWPVNRDGLTQKNLDEVVEIQKRTGGIRDASKAVTYDKLADPTVWRDALALANRR